MLFRKKENQDFVNKVKFDLTSVDKGHHLLNYRGVKMIKCPFDYIIYQMIITKIKPDLIIEIGTNEGGSSYYMSDLLKLNGKGVIHTIDVVDNVHQIVKDIDNIKFFLGGWEAYDISLAEKYDTILIIEDGSHKYEHSIGALNKFWKLVSKNSYFIVEDGIVTQLGIEKQFNGGPQRAIKEFLDTNNEFIIDRSYCDLFGINATFNVNGYLKRK
ncbi:CmcI family methyltransferase [Fulvivirgaceae bacterium LMO-SS25]